MRGLAGALFATTAFAQIQLVPVVSGVSAPTDIADAGDSSGRLFIVEQAGRIRILNNGTLAATPFLDITGRVGCCGERGLLSVAFPPGYAAKGYFYVYYTDSAGDITVSRFRLGAGPDTADPASETVLLKIPHRDYPNHNGGLLEFGPDGYLYIGTGDGGGGGDPLGNGQNTNALLGKLLRIDVESGVTPYQVPASNPFVNMTGYRGEIWAYGLRNPWRYSFDRATSDLYIADVGQNAYEEIDFQPADDRGGENYGWNRMEGMHCYQAGCNTTGLTLPVAEYDHSGGNCSITGGYVYRGARAPSLQGTYLYGDYCSGRIWGLKRSGDAWQNTLLLDTDFAISTFGQDQAGELYLADQAGGVIYRIAGPAPAFTAAGVVDAAQFQPGIVPGSIASLFGTGITTVTGILNASATPLPPSLAGTSVTVNGTAAPLFAVANVNGYEQINFQVPWETAPGKANIVVENNGAASAAVAVDVIAAQPQIFVATAQDGYVVLWATGLGAVMNPPSTGSAAPLGPLSDTATLPGVTVGGVDATIAFAGLAPTLVGLYQVNARFGSGTPSGQQDVVLTIGGNSSRPVKVTVP